MSHDHNAERTTPQTSAHHHPAALGGNPAAPAGRPASPRGCLADEDGSLVTEYGLLAVLAATIAGVVIQWASGGAIVRLFNALLNAARDLVGA